MELKISLRPTNPETEIVSELSLNGVVIYPESGPNESEYLIPLSSAGPYALLAQAFVQGKRQGRAFMEALKSYRNEKNAIKNRLEDGVSEGERVALEKRLSELERLISAVRAKLQNIRTPVGSPVVDQLLIGNP